MRGILDKKGQFKDTRGVREVSNNTEEWRVLPEWCNSKWQAEILDNFTIPDTLEASFQAGSTRTKSLLPDGTS